MIFIKMIYSDYTKCIVYQRYIMFRTIFRLLSSLDKIYFALRWLPSLSMIYIDQNNGRVPRTEFFDKSRETTHPSR